MSKTYTVQLLSEALSPVTHASGTAGNEAIIAREPVITPEGETRMIPFLSGNALRHRCLREAGMRWLIGEYGLAGELTKLQLNFLLHGGNLTESNAHENTARIAEMRRVWPLLWCLGGSLPNQILSGACDYWRGMLVCHENRRQLPASWLPSGRLLPAENFVGGYQYTRGDVGKSGLLAKDADSEASSLMIYSGQAVSRGAFFYHGFTLRHASEVELGAALWSLALWQLQGGTIGGSARAGHGRLRTQVYLPGVDQPTVVASYLDYARAHGAEAVNWLMDAFAAREAKPKAARKPKGAASHA